MIGVNYKFAYPKRHPVLVNMGGWVSFDNGNKVVELKSDGKTFIAITNRKKINDKVSVFNRMNSNYDVHFGLAYKEKTYTIELFSNIKKKFISLCCNLHVRLSDSWKALFLTEVKD